MDSILDLLKTSAGRELITGASQQLGIDKKSAASALTSALPLMLGAMKNNASSGDGAASLLGALSSSKHTGSILNNLGGILGGSGIDDDVLNDGAKILGHVFNGQQGNAANAIGKSTGLNMESAMQLMKIAAPFVMGYLGKQAREKNVSDQSGVQGLLGNLLGGMEQEQEQAASRIQDFDNNDNSIEDIAGMLLGGGKSGGGIGDMLGGMFGKL